MLILKKSFSNLIIALAVSSLLLSSCGEAESSFQSNVSSIGEIVNVSSDESKDKTDLSKAEASDESTDKNSSSDESKDESGSTAEGLSYSVSYKTTDLTTEYEEASAVSLKCSGSSVQIEGNGATAENGIITISNSGVYALSGSLDGRIIVNSADADPVRLILSGISVSCETSAPLYVESADKVIITLIKGTENTFKDSENFVFDDVANEEPSATIFSKDDLTINGEGTLNVEASFKNGIQCKDKLKICGGIINVTSANDGIKGKDCVGICDGKITVKSGGDGIQASNTDAGNVGFVNVEKGTIDITSTLDGIQGENGVCISGGDITIKSGSGNGASSTESKKGLKGTNDITVTGGKISITSTDDGVHSDGSINVEGGEITVSSGDDGFHAEANINIKNGKVNITRSYEGLEAMKINVSGGTTSVKASDDGVNASDGSGGGMGGFGGFGGGGGMQANSSCQFNVSGGFIYVNAQGDGLDSNGNISISGGTVLCEGPTNGGNSSVDHNGSIAITGGMLLSIGSNGMAGEILSSTTGTTQCVFGSYSSGTAGTTLAIKDSAGNVLCVFETSKQFGHLVFSCPEMKTGETYEIWTGGNGNGECINGLYTNNTYEGGSKLASVSQTATVTGGGGGGMMGGGTRPGGNGGTRPSKPNRW